MAQVRAFNRFYTNVIGVLHGMYLDSPFTLTEGRLLFEIARQPAVEVSDLRRALDIDAGYLSRVLSRFEAESLITRHRSAADARRQEIRIANAGRAAAADLDRRSAGQIADAPARRRLRPPAERDAGDHHRARRTGGGRAARRAEATAASRPSRRVVTLRPLTLGDLGWVLHRHATVYAAEFGWDATFEELCARIIAEYTTLRDAHPDRAAGWIAEVDGAGRLGLLRAPTARPPPGSACCWSSRGPAASASAPPSSGSACSSPARPATPTSPCGPTTAWRPPARSTRRPGSP